MEVETEFKNRVIDLERRMYGLRFKDIQRLAFDVSENKRGNIRSTWRPEWLDKTG